MAELTIQPVRTRGERRAFVDFAWRAYADDPNWVPPLKTEVHALLDPAKNPWFEHAEAELFLALRGGEVVGRASAQVDRLVQEHMGAGTGQWGFLDALDEDAARALLGAAEDWLRARGMTRALGPFSLSIWDEPGLLVKGFDQPPTVMMGHHRPDYAGWIEGAGHRGVKDMSTYELDITQDQPPLVRRLVRGVERDVGVRIRTVDKSRFDEEAAIILGILNDAWSDNWGFVPLTPAEIAYAGKKLKPIVVERMIRVAELLPGHPHYAGGDGAPEPVAFMITLPDLNELIRDLDGRLFPFGWAKLLWRLRAPRTHTVRVPLMGVVKRLQASKLTGELAFALIEEIRRDVVNDFGGRRGEIGWILDDNRGMLSVAHALKSRENKVYRVYEKGLA